MKNKPEKNPEDEFRERLRIMLVEQIINLTKNEFNTPEQIITRESLVNNKTFAELKETKNIPIIRQRQILEEALVKMRKSLENAYRNSASYGKYRKEIIEFEEAKSKDKRIETKKSALPKETIALLDKHLQDISVSNRVKNIFENNKLVRVADLLSHSALGFAKYRNSGRKAVAEIETYFKANDLWWGMLE